MASCASLWAALFRSLLVWIIFHSEIRPPACLASSAIKCSGPRYVWLFNRAHTPEPLTTGFRLFAECLRSDYTWQSLCRVRHSAKNTRQKIDRQSPLCRVSFIGHSAKCPGDIRQRKATVTAPVPLTVTLPSANPAGTRQRFFIFFKKKISLPSANPSGTRQRVFIFFTKFLCRVPTFRHSAKIFNFF